MPSDVDNSRTVKNVNVPFEIASVVENTSIDSCPSPSSLDEAFVSPEDTSDTSDVANASVESSTPMPDDITVPKDKLSESIVLHFPVAHYKTPRQIAECNDDYKFAAFPHNILQKFVVTEVTCMFHLDIMMTLHNQRTCSFRILKRNASITYELDIPWDLGISHTFNGTDSIRFNACLSASIIAYDRSVTEACPTPTSVVQL